MKRLTAFGIIAIMALSACSGSTPRMRDLYDPEAGPEEFAVAPSKPLEIPQDLASLPSPTPGGKTVWIPHRKRMQSRY